ncbi:MAG: DNA-directed RNA polymerase subunit omega, partial [Pseudomonadota bacterium]|nr:DNA-directed RNA polymerase subunit omega [Pseudomonadota bacterium]
MPIYFGNATLSQSTSALRNRYTARPFTHQETKMARVTVEDCLDNVDNRFELVLLAAKRAR